MKKFVCKSTATPLPLRKVFVVLVVQFSQVFGKKQLNAIIITSHCSAHKNDQKKNL